VTSLDDLAALLDEIDASAQPVLMVIDDAEHVDDHPGRLAAFATRTATREPDRHCSIVAAGRPDALRQSYGHWTGVIRRSRAGLVAAGGAELDGDLLGVSLSRHLPVAPRVGLFWSVDHAGTRLVQVVRHTSVGGDGSTG
jgi:S-DNA-T family DNA segregation ATPase FtsK/SpoIIIE